MIAGLTTAALVWVAFVVLIVLPICTSSKRRDQTDARRRHPSNYAQATIIPVWCPRCLTQCATAQLSQSGGTVGGWIELRGHECKRVSA